MARFDRALNATSAIAAVAALTLLGWRQFGARDEAPRGVRARAVALSPEQHARVSRLAFGAGQPDGAVQLVAFSDVQCPFCARLDKVVDSLAASSDVALAYGLVHFPLEQHELARAGARALECAREQGRFHELRVQVFTRQTEVSRVPFQSLAHDAGVPDLPRFAECTRTTRLDSLIDRGLALGTELGLQGTPLVVIDGFVLDRPPNAAQLPRVLGARADGAGIRKALRTGGYDVVAPH